MSSETLNKYTEQFNALIVPALDAYIAKRTELRHLELAMSSALHEGGKLLETAVENDEDLTDEESGELSDLFIDTAHTIAEQRGDEVDIHSAGWTAEFWTPSTC